MDGFTGHLALPFLHALRARNYYLVLRYPHSSHKTQVTWCDGSCVFAILQSMVVGFQVEDVAIFGPFKTKYNESMGTIVKNKVKSRLPATLGPKDFNAAIAEPWKYAHDQARICEGFRLTGFNPATRCVYWRQHAAEVAALAKSTLIDRRVLVARLNAAGDASVGEIVRAQLHAMQFNDPKKFHGAATTAALPVAGDEGDDNDGSGDDGDEDEQESEDTPQPRAADMEPRAKRPFQPWAMAGGAASDEVIAHYTAIDEAKAEAERKKQANKEARAKAHAASVDAGNALLANPVLCPATLPRNKCLQVLAALKIKPAEKAPTVADLREEVRKALVLRAQQVQTAPAQHGVGGGSSLLPRGLLV
jgi:hypothetical protein